MATGRNTQLTRQIGEHLVAAKLGRLGFVAAPYAGNVPLFDLLAADVRGYAVPIQVKTINGPSWQLKADAFLEVEVVEGVQHVRGKKKLVNPKVICVFVHLHPDEADEFYVMRLSDVQACIAKVYKGGKRPRNPESMHCALYPKDLASHKDRWPLVEQAISRIR